MSVSRRRRTIAILYVGALALLATLSALDPAGIRKHLRLHDEVRRMTDENRRLAEENARLAREVRGLRSDPATLERAAREELRFVRPGEIVYRLDGEAGASR